MILGIVPFFILVFCFYLLSSTVHPLGTSAWLLDWVFFLLQDCSMLVRNGDRQLFTLRSTGLIIKISLLWSNTLLCCRCSFLNKKPCWLTWLLSRKIIYLIIDLEIMLEVEQLFLIFSDSNNMFTPACSPYFSPVKIRQTHIPNIGLFKDIAGENLESNKSAHDPGALSFRSLNTISFVRYFLASG